MFEGQSMSGVTRQRYAIGVGEGGRKGCPLTGTALDVDAGGSVGHSGEVSGDEGGQKVLALRWGAILSSLIVDSIVCHELTNLVLLSWLSFHTSSGAAQLMSQTTLAHDVTSGSLPHVHSMLRGCFVITIEEQMCYRV